MCMVFNSYISFAVWKRFDSLVFMIEDLIVFFSFNIFLWILPCQSYHTRWWDLLCPCLHHQIYSYFQWLIVQILVLGVGACFEFTYGSKICWSCMFGSAWDWKDFRLYHSFFSGMKSNWIHVTMLEQAHNQSAGYINNFLSRCLPTGSILR